MAVEYGSLPFQEQIDYLRKKVSIPTRAWTDVYGAEHDHAFMVAGAARDDLLTDLRAAVDKAISQGTTLQEFRKDFDQVVAKTGWAYNGGRNWRTHIIYDTNLRQSYNAGREAQMADPELRKQRPYGLYKHADGEAHPRPQHLAWNGTVLPLDDPWWDTHSPQNGWGCNCKKQMLSERDVTRRGLTVATKAPPIEWEERTVGINGPSPRTVRVPKGIDPGFEHRPGADWIRSNTPRPIDGPPPAYVRNGGAKPDMPKPHPLSKNPLPKDGTDAELAQGFLDELGAKGRGAFIFKDPLGELLPLSGELFKDHRGNWKIRKAGRHEFLHVLAETLHNPDEIWLAWQQVKSGPDVLRRRYVRILPGDQDGIAVFEMGRGGWREITVFHITEETARKAGYSSAREYIDQQRFGVRVYARKVGDS